MPPTDERPGTSRFDPSWLLLLAAALFLGRVAFGVWRDAHPPKPRDHVGWVAIGDAEAIARRTGKPILYDFTADWCAPCQQMKQQVFSDAKLARAIEGVVVPVRVLDRSREEGRNPPAVDSLQRAYAVDGFPTLVVYSPETRRSQTSVGFGGGDATARWIETNAMAVRLRTTPGGAPIP